MTAEERRTPFPCGGFIFRKRDLILDSLENNQKPEGMKTASDYMMEFLDADDFADREEILERMHLCEDITDLIIDNMAAAIDISVDDGAIEDRFTDLQNCVRTRAKYETNRLRGGK